MMDKINQKLIQELQDDGRQSYTELARVVGVSEGTIRKRVKDLQNHDVMKIRAVLDPSKIGYSFISIMALQVKMADLHQVADMLVQKPNVYYLAFVAGRYDMLALIVARTPGELSNFFKEHVSNIPSIIKTETFVNLEIIKSPWAETWDIAQLIGDLEGK